MASEKKNIVIIGGGIIGCTSAYFLTRHSSYDPTNHTITLIEASKIAGGASGKAGGLLALWAYPSNIVPLSYRLHAELAREHGGESRWGYRKVHCGQLSAKGRAAGDMTSKQMQQKGSAAADANGNRNGNGTKTADQGNVSLEKRANEKSGFLRARGVPQDLDWFSADSVYNYEEMGDPSTTAQVHPYQFTTSMADLAAASGVKIILGSVTKISSTEKAGVDSVTYTPQSSPHDPQTITDVTDIVISAGPWTKTLLPSAPISALRAHSVTIRPSRPVSAYAIFTEIKLPATISGKKVPSAARHVSPEIYARPNNEVYACGEGDHLVPLPSLSSQVETDDSRCQDIIDHVGSISDELRDGKVTIRQACYLPQVESGGGPMIGLTSIKGLVVASGHTCWGIQNGPGTGKLVSEFVFDGEAKSVGMKALATLDPRRWGL